VKNFLAISFCAAFLVYQIGFVAIYFYAKEKNRQVWITKTEFKEGFKKVSIPLTLPYWQDQDEYQVTDGEMIVGGVHYRKVYQKYAQDSVHILLVLDETMNQIQSSTRKLVAGNTGNETGSAADSNFTFILKNDLQTQADFEFSFFRSGEFIDAKFYYSASFKGRSLSIDSPPPLV
jgi:hypothetical protein